jgi:hypothetical protein
MPEQWPQFRPEPKYRTAEGTFGDLAPVLFDDVPQIINLTSGGKAEKSKAKSDNDLAGLADRAKARKAKKAAELVKGEVVKEAPAVIDLTVDEYASETSSICETSLQLSLLTHSDTF